MKKFIHTSGNKTIILIRLMVGAVFLSEGLQKFIYPAALGAGRFARIGFPAPEFYSSLSGYFEILCGILLLAGFVTRGAALIMLFNISVAIVVTKIPILLGHSFGPFHLRELDRYGFWAMAHEIRTDYSMWLGSLFLSVTGGGFLSVDRLLTLRNEKKERSVKTEISSHL